MIEQRFNVGDMVLIADVKGCRYGFNSAMAGLVGTDTTVTYARYDKYHGAYVYRVDADNGAYAWCDRCLQLIPEKDIHESDMSLDTLLGVR